MKWLVLFLLIGLGGYAWWAYARTHPAAAACHRYEELCGPGTRSQCDQAFDAFAKMTTPPDTDPAVRCLRQAASCPQAAGCLAGAAGRAGINAAGEFLKGVEKSLQK